MSGCSSSKEQSSVIDLLCSSSIEKECEACCGPAQSSGINAIGNEGDVLDWSIAIVSSECDRALERATAHRRSVSPKAVEDDDNDCTDEETVCESDADERSPSFCAVPTPLRNAAVDAGFDRFWQTVSPALHRRCSQLDEDEDEDLASQLSLATAPTVASFDAPTESALSATAESLDKLADEPQAVLCSEFSWLYRHKRIRDTLLSIGATQSVLHEIMMRNRYYDECDQREQRMIVDTYKVRRAVDRARCERAPAGALAQRRSAEPRPCRYVFSDSEDDDEHDAPLFAATAAPRCTRRATYGAKPRAAKKAPKQPRAQSIGKRTRLDASADASMFDFGFIGATAEPFEGCSTPAPASNAGADAAPSETPAAEDANSEHPSRLQPKRKAKEAAKHAIKLCVSTRR